MSIPIFSTAYFPSVEYFSALKNRKEILIEKQEHFAKQSTRNRCEIYGANGKLKLSVPLNYWKEKTKTKDITISYESNWQKLHWKSLESAYRKSPYFEFYEEDLIGFFIKKKFDFLLDFNNALFLKVLGILKMDLTISFTEGYNENYSDDYRNSISKKESVDKTFAPYRQTFENKFGFIPNLSILDLIFNQGPNAKDYF